MSDMRILDEAAAEGLIIQMATRAAEAERELGKNFVADGKTYLVRCPKCGKENWAPNVASGVCAWCGYDAISDISLCKNCWCMTHTNNGRCCKCKQLREEQC